MATPGVMPPTILGGPAGPKPKKKKQKQARTILQPALSGQQAQMMAASGAQY